MESSTTASLPSLATTWSRNMEESLAAVASLAEYPALDDRMPLSVNIPHGANLQKDPWSEKLHPQATPGHQVIRASDIASPVYRRRHLQAVGVTKSYRKGALSIPVLRGVNLDVAQGEFLAIVGQSGSGKSTLLHLLATLDVPDQGEIHFEGERIDNVSRRIRDRLRNQRLGMIFQFYHLLPELTTLENVLMPLMIGRGIFSYLRTAKALREKAQHLLNLVGLSHRLHHKPCEMSGGEMQRAAIARALIAGPAMLLADEPTGNLDAQNGAEILRILQTLNKESGLTLVMVTHDAGLAQQADRVVRLHEGQVVQAG